MRWEGPRSHTPAGPDHGSQRSRGQGWPHRQHSHPGRVFRPQGPRNFLESESEIREWKFHPKNSDGFSASGLRELLPQRRTSPPGAPHPVGSRMRSPGTLAQLGFLGSCLSAQSPPLCPQPRGHLWGGHQGAPPAADWHCWPDRAPQRCSTGSSSK